MHFAVFILIINVSTGPISFEHCVQWIVSLYVVLNCYVYYFVEDVLILERFFLTDFIVPSLIRTHLSPSGSTLSLLLSLSCRLHL